MNFKDKLKSKLRKGAGTLVAFSVTLACVLVVYLLCMSIIQLNIGLNEMETGGELIVRELVTCSSLNEAQKKASKLADDYFSDYKNITNVQVEVGLASGSDTWTRGDYVQMFLYGTVDSLFLASRERATIHTAMTEHSGEYTTTDGEKTDEDIDPYTTIGG